jgi:Fe-Mn family superoxide dismutase
MSFTLPQLPYAVDALEPAIDKMTMEIHHGKHHAAYVANLNKALESAPDLAGKSLDELLAGGVKAVPESIRTAVRNNGGGHWNHAMFWQIMGAPSTAAPSGALVNAIKAKYGELDHFKTQFNAAGMGRFGSGWAWLIAAADGSVDIMSTPNQDNPMMEGKYAVIGCDVWEHAYYLKYQNRRADYLAAWWSVVNWAKAEEIYGKRK